MLSISDYIQYSICRRWRDRTASNKSWEMWRGNSPPRRGNSPNRRRRHTNLLTVWKALPSVAPMWPPLGVHSLLRGNVQLRSIEVMILYQENRRKSKWRIRNCGAGTGRCENCPTGSHIESSPSEVPAASRLSSAEIQDCQPGTPEGEVSLGGHDKLQYYSNYSIKYNLKQSDGWDNFISCRFFFCRICLHPNLIFYLSPHLEVLTSTNKYT